MLEGGESTVEIQDPILSNMDNWVHHTHIDLSTHPRPPSTEPVFFYIPFTICYLFITL